MPTLSRTLRAALTLLLATTLAVTVSEAASGVPNVEQGTTPASATRTATSTGHDPVDLHGDEVTPPRAGRAARVQKWKVRTLYYYETMPAKWDWSLSTAVRKWNASGGRIRLARTASPGKAHVRISYARIGSAAGMATLGATRNARVYLSSRFSTVNALDARNRVIVMKVFAHELGHVLGFRHTSDPCSLMAPVLDVDRCGDVPTAKPGYYRCRTLDLGLARRFVALYGGTVRYPAATWCSIDPLPPVVAGVSFAGGMSEQRPVSISWTPPTTVPPGWRVLIRRWRSTICGAASESAFTFSRPVSPGVWEDTAGGRAGSTCFRVQLVNRYGAGSAHVGRLLARWVPRPEAPVVGSPAFDRSAATFAVPVTVPDGTQLEARWDSADPTSCVTDRSGGDAQPMTFAGGVATISPSGSFRRCVSFFAVDENDLSSTAAPVTLSPPMPAAPEVDFASWTPSDHSFSTSATYPPGTHLTYVVGENASDCPGAYTLGGDAVVEDPERPGIVQFFSDRPDVCVSFYAVDDVTAAVSEPTSIVAEAPLPTETVDVGDLYQYGTDLHPAWYAVVTGQGAGNRVAAASLEGPCPAEVPDDLRWWSWDPADSPTTEPDEYIVLSRGLGVHCAFFTAMDVFGYSTDQSTRHGPVVAREFTQEGIAPPAVESVEWDDTNGVVVIRYSGVGWRRVVAQVNPSDPGTCPTTFDPQQNYWSGYLEDGIAMDPPAQSFCLSTFYYDDQPWGDVISPPVMRQVTIPN